MILFPAIDLKDNTCVRLRQGDFNQVTYYSNKPAEIARLWKSEGATYLHLVDLNGADTGEIVNLPSIQEIINGVNIQVQVGGGIRDLERVKYLLNLGVARVILGTVAIENKDLLKQLVHQYNDQIVVSIDAKDGQVATRGWKVVSQVNSLDLCQELESIGVKTIVYTDIAKDGMLSGPNFKIYEEIMKKTNLNVIVSGGVSSLEDIKKLKQLNVYGAIIGKALYEKKLSLKEAISCLQNA